MIDSEEFKNSARIRLARRQGDTSSDEKFAARERLNARRELGGLDTEANSSDNKCAEDLNKNSGFVSRMRNFIASLAKNQFFRFAALGAIVLIFLIIVLMYVLGTGASSNDQTQNNVDNLSQGDDLPIDFNSVVFPEGLSLSDVEILKNEAQTNTQVATILENIDAYDVFGETDKVKLLSLAAKETQARKFVAELPALYPKEGAESLEGSLVKGNIPSFYQWDTRWSYTTYSGAPFGITGCAPTALSMVYCGLTGDISKSPSTMAELAYEKGYVTDSHGTLTSFLIDEADGLGLDCALVDLDVGALKAGLSQGYVYIANVGPGDFTSEGHFIVITKVTEDGTLQIHDPFSRVNSEKTWDATSIVGQTISLFSYKQQGS
jgi:hypothetical protein